MQIKNFIQSGSLLLFLCVVVNLYGQKIYPQTIDPQQVTIARDEWGVAHIFAKTDAEVAFGLAWANSEDAFPILQDMLILTKTKAGIQKGKEGAAFDFFVKAIDAKQTVDSFFNTLDADFLLYINGYVQGINAYAKAHPKEVARPNVFPIESKDLVRIYLIAFAALSGSPEAIQNIVSGAYDKTTQKNGFGSNAYAFNSKKTADGKTYLCMNPHFFVEGPFAFYEAHLCSEQGLNMTGALFHGGTSVFIGNNENLGWGQTYNYVDQVDIYKLEMHPSKKLYYKLDDKYLKLEKKPIKLRVKIGKIVIPVRKMAYKSQHGLVLKSPKGEFYAIKSPSFSNVKVGEQYYKMNKAANYEEWKAALDLNSLNMFNIVYADKNDNIFYISNARLPKRNKNYDYSDILNGNVSENIWTEFHTQDELPQVKNPTCGYVFNMNNTPTNATCAEENFPRAQTIPEVDLRPGDNSRSTRFMEMLAAKGGEKFSFEEFKSLKFDLKISKNTHFFKTLSLLYSIKAENYPHIEEAIKIVQEWDGDASPENTSATLFMISIENVLKKYGLGDETFILGLDGATEADFVAGIEQASAFLLKHHNSIKVPVNQVLSHYRNGKFYPISGYPDALSPAFGTHVKNGKYKMDFADTYIHFVKFNSKGAETIETLLPFELTRTCENYKDELEMFNKREMKKMSLDKSWILKNAVKVYNPVKK